jgi:hypothetical protein
VEIWLALILPLPPPLFPPPEWPALDLALAEGLAEAAVELADEDAAFPSSLIVAVSPESDAVEAEREVDAEWTVFAWPALLEIKGLVLDGEAAETIMTMNSLPGRNSFRPQTATPIRLIGVSEQTLKKRICGVPIQDG